MKYVFTAALSAFFLMSLERAEASRALAKPSPAKKGWVSKAAGALPVSVRNFLGLSAYESAKSCVGEACADVAGAAEKPASAFQQLSQGDLSQRSAAAQEAGKKMAATAYQLAITMGAPYDKALEIVSNVMNFSANWDKPTAKKAMAFIIGGADGLDAQEKAMAEEVMENCGSGPALAPAI